MAKKAYRRWQGWRVDASGKDIATERFEKSRKRKSRGLGITNEQAKYLAKLQRQAGLKYTGAGMSRADASALIDKLVRERDERRTNRPTRRHAA